MSRSRTVLAVFYLIGVVAYLTVPIGPVEAAPHLDQVPKPFEIAFVEPFTPAESPQETIAVPRVVAPQIGDAITTERELAFALPVPVEMTTREILSRPHHDYPSADIVVPVGTFVSAVSGGYVTRATPNDGAACGGTVQIQNDLGLWTYCHLSGILTEAGTYVLPGQVIALSGGKPGARGAGSSSIPHVHISWLRSGRLSCPQPLLLSIWDGQEPNLTVSTRCVS